MTLQVSEQLAKIRFASNPGHGVQKHNFVTKTVKYSRGIILYTSILILLISKSGDVMIKKRFIALSIITAIITVIFSLSAIAQDTCSSPCTDDTNCASGEACGNGCCAPNACQITCDENTLCTIDQTCSNGCCTPIACSQNSDCPEPLCPEPAAGVSPNVFFPLQCNFCQDGFCIDPPVPTCGTSGCSCTGDSGCDDSNKCTIDTCVSGGCVFTTKNCADSFGCTTDSCSASSGNCVNTEVDSACNDGIACTDDKCSKNTGCSNTEKNNLCDDGLQCTSDSCDALGGGCFFSCTDTDGDGICD